MQLLRLHPHRLNSFVDETVCQQVLAQGDDGQKSLLPVYFMAETAEGARNRAIAFWNDENAKKEAKAERGRKLGLARRKKLPVSGS